MFLFSRGGGKKKDSSSSGKRTTSPFDRNNNAEQLREKQEALEAERAQFVIKSKEFVRASIALHRVSFIYCQPLPGRMAKRWRGGVDDASPTTLLMADYDISEVAFRQFNGLRQGQRLTFTSGPRAGRVVIVVGIYGGKLVTQEFGDFPREFDRDDTFAENSPVPLLNAVDVALPTYPFDGITVQGKTFTTNGVTMLKRFGYLHGTRVLHRTGIRVGSTGVILGILPENNNLYEYNEVSCQCMQLKGTNRSDLDDAHGFAVIGYRGGNPGPVSLPSVYEFPCFAADAGKCESVAFDVRFSVLQSMSCGPHGQVVMITRGPRYGTVGCIIGCAKDTSATARVYCLFDLARGAEWMNPDLGIVPMTSVPAKPMFFSRALELLDVTAAGLTTIGAASTSAAGLHRRSSVANFRNSICGEEAGSNEIRSVRRHSTVVNYPASCGWIIPINTAPDACHRFHLFHGQRVIFGLRTALQEVFLDPLDEVRSHNLAARGWRLGTVLGTFCDEMWILCDDTKVAEPLADCSDFATMTAKYVIAPFERDARAQFDIRYVTTAAASPNPHHYADPFLNEKTISCTVSLVDFRETYLSLPRRRNHLKLFRVLEQAQVWMFDTSASALAEIGATLFPCGTRVRRIARIPPRRRPGTDAEWESYSKPKWFTVVGVASGGLYVIADEDPAYAQRVELDGCVAIPPTDPEYRSGPQFIPMLPPTFMKNPKQQSLEHEQRQLASSGQQTLLIGRSSLVAAGPYVAPPFTGDTRAVRDAARTSVTAENQREMGLLFGLLPKPCRLLVAEWLLHCFGIKLEDSENLYDAYALLVAVRRLLPKQQLAIPTLHQWRLQELAMVASAEQTARQAWEHDEAKWWRQTMFRQRTEEQSIAMALKDTENDLIGGLSRVPRDRKGSALADRWRHKVDYKFLANDSSSMFLPKNHKPSRFYGHNYLEQIKSFSAFRRLTFDRDGFPEFPPSDDEANDNFCGDKHMKQKPDNRRRPVSAGGALPSSEEDDDGDLSSGVGSVVIDEPKFSQALTSPFAKWKTVGTGSAIALEKRIHLRPVIRLAGMAAAKREVALDVSNKPQPTIVVDAEKVAMQFRDVASLSACAFPFPYITSAGTTIVFDISVAACSAFGMFHGQTWLIGRGDARGKELVILGVANNQLWRYSDDYDASPFCGTSFDQIVQDHQLTPVRDHRTSSSMDPKLVEKPRDCDAFYFVDFRGEVQHFLTSPEALSVHQVKFGDRFMATAGTNVVGSVLTIIGVSDGKLWYARDWSGARPHEGTTIIQDFGLRYLYTGPVDSSIRLFPEKASSQATRTVVCSLLGSRSGFAAFDASETNLATWGVRCGQQFVITRGPQSSHQGTIIGTHWGKLYRLIDGERHATPFEATSIQNFLEVYELRAVAMSAGRSSSPRKGQKEQADDDVVAQSKAPPLPAPSKLPFVIDPIIEKCPTFVARQSGFRFRVRSGDVLHFDIRDSICRTEFGFSHGDKVMLQKPLKESGKLCTIVGVREKKLWKVDDRDTVASSFPSARSYADLIRDYNLALIGRGNVQEWTG